MQPGLVLYKSCYLYTHPSLCLSTSSYVTSHMPSPEPQTLWDRQQCLPLIHKKTPEPYVQLNWWMQFETPASHILLATFQPSLTISATVDPTLGISHPHCICNRFPQNQPLSSSARWWHRRFDNYFLSVSQILIFSSCLVAMPGPWSWSGQSLPWPPSC